MFKWYFEMHPEENTGNWKSEYTAPLPGSREELDNYCKHLLPGFRQITRRYLAKTLRRRHSKRRNSREALPSIFVNSDEYKMKFVSHLKDGVSLCIMGYHDGLDMIKESIEACEHYVKEIHVQGDNFTEEDLAELKEWGTQVHIPKWKDQFSDYKNLAISYAGTKWVLVLTMMKYPPLN